MSKDPKPHEPDPANKQAEGPPPPDATRHGDMISINEPPGSQTKPAEDPAEASPPDTKNVSHETSDDDDEGDEHGHSKRGGARRHR